jgi:hypothetical protein
MKTILCRCKKLVSIVLLFAAIPSTVTAQTIGWDPDFLDFGVVSVGSTEYRTLTLTNTASGGVLAVSGVEYTFNQQGAFGWNTAEPLTVELGPGESMEVVLSFTPPDISFFMADLLVTSNALNTPNGLNYSFMGQGEIVDGCFPLTSCGGGCVDVTSDINNCGNCAIACPVPANASALCETSNCGFACDAGYEPLGDGCIPVGTSIVDLTDLLIDYWIATQEPPPTIVGLGPGKSGEHRLDREATAGLSAHIVAVIEELDGLLPEGCPIPEPTARP